MPTFTSPVALSDFQSYLNDTSTDTALLDFYQSLLDTATEFVYRWLDRDYTASAAKIDVFWGNDAATHVPRNPVGTLLSWVYIDNSGVQTNAGVGDLMLRSNGDLVMAKTSTFQSGFEHRLSYQQPGDLECPETVKQVILEMAAMLFVQSNRGAGALGLLIASSREVTSTDREHYLDLSDRHKSMLRPYRRLSV